jgi:hypothetical protein
MGKRSAVGRRDGRSAQERAGHAVIEEDFLPKGKHVNPYIAGAPVTGPDMFFGREDVFSFVQRNLVGGHRDSPIVLYGQRRTGKTSVLYQLRRRLGPGYRCVYIDLHGLDLGSLGGLLSGIAGVVCRGLRQLYQINVGLPDRSAILAEPRSAFGDVFLEQVLTVLGEDHLVLMFDETDRLDEEDQAGHLDHEVFDYLRYLMQHYPRLNFIFALGSGLEELGSRYASMFRVSLYHRISFLDQAAAVKLVTEPVRGNFAVSPEAVAEIWQVTSGHPYYLQLVCQCLFDLWTQEPRPEMGVSDAYDAFSKAIERGSPNLTSVWGDSTPEERLLMAGMSAAMGGGHRPVTDSQVLKAWRASGVVIPARQIGAAQWRLASREVIVGDYAHSFAVDLQRLWLDQHRRLDWVRDELADSIREWDREARAARRNGNLLVIAILILASGYFGISARIGWPPFTSYSPWSGLQQALPGDLSNKSNECLPVTPHVKWRTVGLDFAVRCNDPGLAGGDVYGYHFDSTGDLNAAWQSFNASWGFSASTASGGCPPSGDKKGLTSFGSSQVECGILSTGGAKRALYADYVLAGQSFSIAESALGDESFSALQSWISQT